MALFTHLRPSTQGVLFLVMGGAVLLLPDQTIAFSVHNPPKADLFRIVWQCFGSQVRAWGASRTQPRAWKSTPNHNHTQSHSVFQSFSHD